MNTFRSTGKTDVVANVVNSEGSLKQNKQIRNK